MSTEPRVFQLPVFIDVSDVQVTMKCSRSRAYEHMRTALGRRPGERGQIRVPVYVWERYVRERFDPEVRGTESESRVSSRREPRSSAPPTTAVVRLTRPRTRPRPGTEPQPPDALQSPRVIAEPADMIETE